MRYIQQIILKLFFAFFMLFFSTYLYAESEPNNACAQANLLFDSSTQTNSGFTNGKITNGSDDDWYKLLINQKAQYTLNRTKKNNKKTIIKLFKSDCITNAGWTHNGKTRSKNITLDIGTYYLKVSRSNTNNAQYKVNAKARYLSDLSIVKNVNNPTPLLGSAILYTITATNNGNKTSDFKIIDTLPSGLSFDTSYNSDGVKETTSNFSCSTAGQIATCQGWHDFITGDSVTITIQAIVNQTGTLINTTSVISRNNRFDNDLSNNTSIRNVTVSVPNSADLRVSALTAPIPDPVDVASDVMFFVHMQNAGPDVALANVMLTTVYDQAVVISSVNQPSDFSCSPSSGALAAFTPITCTKTTQMNSGATKDFIFIVQPSTVGTLLQTSDVASTSTTDPDTLNNMVQTPVTVNPANIAPISTDGNESTRVNNILTIDMNNHASDSDGSLASVTVTSAPSPDYTMPPPIGTTVFFDPTLNFEGNTSFDYFVTDNDGLDSNVSTIYVSVVSNFPPIAFDRNYTTLDTVALVGNLITGTGQSTGTNTPDSDPDGDTLTIASYTQPSAAFGSLTMAIGGDGNFTFAPVPGQGGADANFTYTIEDGFGGTAEANVSIHLLPAQANLGTSKTAPSSVLAGAPMSYTVTITSEAGAQFTDAHNVRMTDNLPSGFLFNGFTSPTGWTCGFVGGTITCDIASLSPGTTDILLINGFAPNIPGTIVNSATIISTTHDTNTSNDDSNVSTIVDAVDVDMVITKAASPTPVITASLLTYTLTVRNNGTDDTTGVIVEDRLDSSLLFVSVDGGGDWSCSQGSVILCEYTANGGIFLPGATPSDIVIKVTTPVVAGDINNTATVKSDLEDIDNSNNEANVTVTVEDGTAHFDDDVPLTKYLQYNIFGDTKLIGNANINKPAGANDSTYNNNIDMTFVNTDNDPSTYNSSSSRLSLQPDYEIVWAGLYWAGHICRNGGVTTGCDYSSIPAYSNYSQAKSSSALGSVKFKTPNSTYNISANTLYTVEKNHYIYRNRRYVNVGKTLVYSAFTDITNLLQKNVDGKYLASLNNGSYTVGNIVTTEGKSDRLINTTGNYGGWSMLTIYKDLNRTLHFKNISLFNGFQYMQDDSEGLSISGFLTPRNGDINASISYFTADGDPTDGGNVQMLDTHTSTYEWVGGDVLNPIDNLMNSTISEFGVDFNGIGTTYGIDADKIDVSSFMTNLQTDTEFKFYAATPNGDFFSISFFAFATDLTTPIIDNFSKSAEIIDANGTVRGPASPDELIYPGNELRYTLIFTNSGDEVAEQVEILDDFDLDGLTPALDLSNFDITKVHLYSGISPFTSADEIANACGYNVLENRVYCRLATVEVNATYTMQFSVTVKSSFTTDVLDKNATNTAYAKYKNPNGDSYVIDINVGGEDFGGNSNTFNGGTFALRDPRSSTFIHLDAINNNYSYNGNNRDRNITTKIVNEPFNIKLVHIDRGGNNSGYQQLTGRPMPVILSLSSDPSTLLVSDPSTIQFTQNADHVIANIKITKAFRNDTLHMGYLDWLTIMSWVAPNSPCVTDTSFSVKLKGLPSCFNTLQYAQDVFSLSSFEKVTNICYGQGGTLPAGSDFACDTSSYGAGSVATGNISPSQYNHPYGCYHCITDAYANFRHSSSDAFAARPKSLKLSSSYVGLLHSGNDYNLSISALDALDGDTEGYTRSLFNNVEKNTTKYLHNGTSDDISTPLLHGTVNLQNLYSDYNITDGISVSASTVSNEVVKFSYDDVGKINIQFKDSSWASVDLDDTPQDCTTNTVTINGITIPIEASAHICGDINATFIPDHFTVSNVKLDNHNDGNFTYLSNDLNMSAHVGVTIEAKNSADTITQNFRSGAQFYENPMLVSMSLTANPHPTNNASNIKDIPNEISLGFGADVNGSHTIDELETNTSQQLLFNFNRTNNAPVNPFDYNGSDINISVLSTYSGTSLDGVTAATEIIRGDGTGVIGDKAHFFYARARSTKEFYNNIDTSSINTPLMLQVYCDNWLGCPELDNINDLNTSDNDWKINQDHNASKDDGNITLTSPPTKLIGGSGHAPTVTTTADITTLGKNDAVTVNRGGTAGLPMTLGINLNTVGLNTSSWLIYNPSGPASDPNPFYRVKFIGTSGWTGFGKTGNVVDANASTKIHNRLGW